MLQGEHGKQAGAEESDDDLDVSDEDEDPPQLHIVKVAHHGGINRVRSMPQEPGIIGTWGDTGLVQVGGCTTRTTRATEGWGADISGADTVPPVFNN